MIRSLCPDVHYWVDVLFTLKFVLLMLTCGIPMIPVLSESVILDAKLRSPLRIRICIYTVLTVLWVCCILGLIFIPSVDAVKLTCLGD